MGYEDRKDMGGNRNPGGSQEVYEFYAVKMQRYYRGGNTPLGYLAGKGTHSRL